MRATGMPICIATMTVSTAVREIGELAHRRGNRLRHAVQAQLDLGDDAERAFRADVEAREIVAGRRLARAAAGAHDAAVGRHDREAEHVLAHRAVAHGVGAGRARRRHAADRRVGARIDREEQARALELGVELLARHARLHAAVEIGRIDLEHLVHLRQVDAHAAVQRRHVALERRADAERDHRHARRVAQAHDGGDLLVACAGTPRRRAMPASAQPFAVAVLLADRRAHLGALAEIADQRAHQIGGHARVVARERAWVAWVIEIPRQKRGRSGCGTSPW